MTPRRRHAIAIVCLIGLAAPLSACATNANYPWERAKAQEALEEEAAENTAPVPPTRLDEDRRAILAMAGEYRVTSWFKETVPFVAGYALKKPSLTEGGENVRVIKDDSVMISLEYTHVAGESTIKRWRQDWIYEPKEIFAYTGRNNWEQRELSAYARRGKWAQLVYQDDESPHYAAIGSWVHENGVSSWTSAPVWRPLPRREALNRDDYDVLLGVNRLAITPTGWVQEEDNTKLTLRSAPKALVREIGLNTYTRSKGIDAATSRP